MTFTFLAPEGASLTAPACSRPPIHRPAATSIPRATRAPTALVVATVFSLAAAALFVALAPVDPGESRRSLPLLCPMLALPVFHLVYSR